MHSCSRIVFLINENQFKRKKDVLAVKIHLACLRLLSYFYHHSSSFLWGYKFYNSAAYTSNKYKNGQFLDYTVANFEVFEQVLYKKTETVFREDVSNWTALKTSLAEILTDFQWDRPELLSPRKCAESGLRSHGNMVFLFSAHPTNCANVFDFHDGKSFANVFLPSTLREKFVDQVNIKLYWVGTSSGDMNMSLPANKIVLDGLNIVNGSLLHIQTLTLSHESNFALVSRDALLESALDSGRPNEINVCSCSVSSELDTDLLFQIFVCPVTKHSQRQLNKVSLKKILPRSVMTATSCETAFMFTVCKNQEAIAIMKSLQENNKIYEVSVDMRGSLKQAFMLPYTYVMGVILVMGEDGGGLHSESAGASDLQTSSLHLPSTECHSSLVNFTDAWFLSNPHLGFPAELKKKYNFEEEQSEKNREESSRKIVNFLKTKFNDKLPTMDKQPSSLKLSKGQRLKGVSWARWRLAEYKEKTKKKTREVETKKTDSKEAVSKSVEEKHVVQEDLTSIDELRTFVEQKYKGLVENLAICHYGIRDLLHNIVKYFEKNKEQELNEFLNSALFTNVAVLREKWNGFKNNRELIHEMLLQLHLLLESAHHGVHSDSTVTMILSLLRTLTFEESTMFLREHLKKIVLPRYRESLSDLLREIYADLMIEPPSELESRESDEQSLSPLTSTQPSVLDDVPPSIPSLQSGSRSLKRIPSVVGDASKRTITIHQTKSKKKKKKRTNENGSRSKVPMTPIKGGTVIPDTPEAKQISALLWKKQDRDRRHSQVDKTMAPIEESPLKELSGEPRFYRSNSTSVISSPRRFYKLKRHNTMSADTTRQSDKFRRHSTVAGSNSQSYTTLIKTPNSALKLRRKSVLFSNFTEDPNETLHSSARRCIFAGPSLADSQSSSDSFKPHAVKRKLMDNDFQPKRRRVSSDEAIHSADVCDFLTENTVDWLEKIEATKTPSCLTFGEALAKLPQDNSCKSSPTVVKAGDLSISVSPSLSATSIQRLEKAPIISPYCLKGNKRGSRRSLGNEY